MSRARPRGWVLAALLIGSGLALPQIARRFPGWLEQVYAEKLFPNLMELLVVPARQVPWSVAQVLLLTLAVVLVVGFLHALSRARKKRSVGAFFAGTTGWLTAAGVVIWAFYLVWGLHYARAPLASLYGLTPKPADVTALCRVTRLLAADVNHSYRLATTRNELGQADDSPSRLLQSRDELAKVLSSAHGLHLARMARVDLPSPKSPALMSELLSRLGISGIYIPFTGEATINGLMPDAAIPFVMAHEMAHQRGVAREDEANFAAWLACRESGMAAARYSASLSAYSSFLGALREAAPDSARALNQGLLDPGPSADRLAIWNFWKRYEGPGNDLAEAVNDTYLKGNAQPEGVRTYGRMVDLILAHEADGRWDPGW